MAQAFTLGTRHNRSKSTKFHSPEEKPPEDFGTVYGYDFRRFRHQNTNPPQILRSKKGMWLDKRHSVEDFLRAPSAYHKQDSVKHRSAHSSKGRIREGDVKNLTPKFQDFRISSSWTHHSAPLCNSNRSWYRKGNKKRNRVTCNNIVRVIKPVCMKNNREEMEIYYEKLKGWRIIALTINSLYQLARPLSDYYHR